MLLFRPARCGSVVQLPTTFLLKFPFVVPLHADGTGSLGLRSQPQLLAQTGPDDAGSTEANAWSAGQHSSRMASSLGHVSMSTATAAVESRLQRHRRQLLQDGPPADDKNATAGSGGNATSPPPPEIIPTYPAAPFFSGEVA
jgi:hypothetical protein